MKRIPVFLLCVLMFACNRHGEEHNIQTRSTVGPDVATIYREKETKSASLSIETEKVWKLYAGLTVETIDLTAPVLVGEGSGDFTLNVPDDVRSYFLLEMEGDSTILAERHLPMTGGYNFRDLGGFETTDGRIVKWGKLFRSDELNQLTDADLDYLASIPLLSIVDFRSDEERSQAPDRNPPSVFQNYYYSINPGNLSGLDSLLLMEESELDTLMMEMNYLFVTQEEIIDRYKDFFALMQNEDHIPLLFHCTAGKDRTGMGTALILFALGVDENTIMEDYLASNMYLEDKYGDMISQYPNLRALLGVKYEYLQTGIQKIKDDHGTVETYLEDILEVNLEAFRDMYLY